MAKEDAEDEQYAASDEPTDSEAEETTEDELENDEISGWEEGFTKGEKDAEFQEGEVEETTTEEGTEEHPKKKKKHEETEEEEII